MAVRKTVLKRDTGVVLTRVEEHQGSRPGPIHYRLTTLRPDQPRVIADLGQAETAFEREVARSKADPVCVRLAAQA